MKRAEDTAMPSTGRCNCDKPEKSEIFWSCKCVVNWHKLFESYRFYRPEEGDVTPRIGRRAGHLRKYWIESCEAIWTKRRSNSRNAFQNVNIILYERQMSPSQLECLFTHTIKSTFTIRENAINPWIWDGLLYHQERAALTAYNTAQNQKTYSKSQKNMKIVLVVFNNRDVTEMVARLESHIDSASSE